MRQRYFWICLVVLVALFSGIMILFPGSHAMAAQAHAMRQFATPTPTPDASTILQTAQQEEANIQTILGILNFIIVAYPVLLTLAAVILGIIGVRGYRSFQEQARTQVDDITKLKMEAEEKKVAIERTQTALIYLALGDRLSNQKEMREAIEAYKKVGSLLPDDPQINFVLGRIYSGAGYYEEAIQSFDSAIAVQSKYPEAEMELGLAYRRRGEYQQGLHAQAKREEDFKMAKEHLLRAIELRPHYGDALSSLGGLFRREEDYGQALVYYEQAYHANPDWSYPLGNAASLARYLGKVDLARRYYTLTEATAEERLKDPHSEIYWDYYDLALAQLVLGKVDEAKKNYEKAIGETPGVVQFDSVLNVLKFLQQAKDPIPSLDDVIQMIEKGKSTKIALG